MSKPTTTQEQLEPGEPTIGEVLRWLEKLELLSGEGAKVLHVKNLLTTVIDATRKETEKEMVILKSDLMRAIGYMQGTGHLDPYLAEKYLSEREEKK